MKAPFFFAGLLVMGISTHAQIKLPVALPNAQQAVQGLKNAVQGSEGGLTQEEIGQALKEALRSGVDTGVSHLAKVGGIAQNPIYRIPLPPEVMQLKDKIQKNPALKLALQPKLDILEAKMNEGAEQAMKSAAPIFREAIVSMTLQDALGILQGEDQAATAYLQNTTQTAVQNALAPVIKDALDAVEIARYWTPVVEAINANKILLGVKEDINPDLPAYVNALATVALFKEIGMQEKKIRQNPLARTSELLKKVFGSKLALG